MLKYFPMEGIAAVACVIAAVLGAVSITTHSPSLQSIVGLVAGMWMIGWVVFNKAYTREFWLSINRPIGELLRKPIPRPGLMRVMGFGMLALAVFATVLRFF